MLLRELERVSGKHKGLLAELSIAASNVVDVSVALEEAAVAREEEGEGEGSGDSDKLEKLRKSMRAFVNMEQMIKNHMRVVDEVKGKAREMETAGIALGEEEGENEEESEKEAEEEEGRKGRGKKRKAKQKKSKPKKPQAVDLGKLMEERGKEFAAGQDEEAYKTHPKYKEFVRKVWAVRHPDETYPEDLEGGEELVVMNQYKAGSTQDALTCPITKKTLQDPVKNKMCGHVYSKEAILHHVNSMGRRLATCPVAGCSAKVTRDGLEEDPETTHKLRRFLRSAKRQRTDNYTQL